MFIPFQHLKKKISKIKKLVLFFKNQYFFSYYFYILKYLFQLPEVALICISHSESFIRIWIHMQIQFLNIPTFEKKNFKHKKMSTFLQKSVLFFILFLHLKIFISIIRSCIDVYITFGKFHTYLYTYEDSIFKHSNIWKKNFKHKKN